MLILSLKYRKSSTFDGLIRSMIRPMKNAMIILACLVFSLSKLHAQTGQVSIEQDPKIDKLMDIYKKGVSSSTYFTIQIGFGNYELAENLKAEASDEFPQWRAKIVFDSPTYRVQLGRFKTRLEAEKQYQEVRKKYPGALILRPGTEN